MKRALRILPFLLLLPTTPAQAQSDQEISALRRAVQEYRAQNADAILEELTDFLRLPNNAADSAAIRANADRILEMLRARGIQGRLLEVPGSPPAVYGEMRVPDATHTVVFYAHYDGQPVDLAAWSTPPFEPTIKGDRIYARSASDDKSPIVAMLTALDALKAAGARPSVNLKFFFEGEEEAGSPHMRRMLTRYRDLLEADLWLFCDGPVHQSRRLQAVFGVRGVMGVNLTVYGPLNPLHSGHYGNWAPNPATRLVHLLADLRAEDGTILIDGFYDDVRPITETDRAAIARVPPVEELLQEQFGLGSTEGGETPLLERIMLPGLNVDGLLAGGVGAQSRNAVPSQARAYLDFRLVPDQSPERVRALLLAHLQKKGWTVVESEPSPAERRAHERLIRVTGDGGYPAVRTAMDTPAAHSVVRSASAMTGQDLIRVPLLGGSLPMYVFGEVLGEVPLVILPMVNHDNNQHASDENLRLQNLWDGIDMYAGVMALLGRYWVNRD